MNLPKKRGRPKSAATLESERIAEMLKNKPAHLPNMTAVEQKQAVENFTYAEKIRVEILKTYKTSATIPDAHAYLMASIGDESLIDHAHEILQQDSTYQEQAQTNRDTGANAVCTNAKDRAQSLCRKNRVLLERLKPFGPLTLSDVASKILKEWAIVHPDALLPGEATTLTRRGVEGDPPTTKTIKNYIRAASPFPQQRVGKTSLRKQ